MKTPPRYTMRFAFQKICEGQGLWIALGNFLNYWFEDAKDCRYALVAEPLEEAPEGEQKVNDQWENSRMFRKYYWFGWWASWWYHVNAIAEIIWKKTRPENGTA